MSLTMVKPTDRSYSQYTREALRLMGRLIRAGRTQRKLTAQDMAERAEISRALLQRIEKGDPGCSIGAVFEAAVIAGVPLFEDDLLPMSARLADAEARLALLPKAVRVTGPAVRDDF